MERTSDKVATPAAQPTTYERPRITFLGTVAELTRGESGPGNDTQNIAT